MKDVAGTEFPAGSGVSGRIGQERFHALKLYLKRNYYDDTELARNNCKALAKQLSALVEVEEQKRESGADWGYSQDTEAARIPINPELDTLQDMEWSMYMGGAGVGAICRNIRGVQRPYGQTSRL